MKEEDRFTGLVTRLLMRYFNEGGSVNFLQLEMLADYGEVQKEIVYIDKNNSSPFEEIDSFEHEGMHFAIVRILNDYLTREFLAQNQEKLIPVDREKGNQPFLSQLQKKVEESAWFKEMKLFGHNTNKIVFVAQYKSNRIDKNMITVSALYKVYPEHRKRKPDFSFGKTTTLTINLKKGDILIMRKLP